MSFDNKYLRQVEIVCLTLPEIKWESPSFLNYRGHKEPSVYGADIRELSELIPFLTSLLDTHELEKSKKYFLEQDKNRFIISRGISKILIGGYLNKKPTDVSIVSGFNKKPEVSGFH